MERLPLAGFGQMGSVVAQGVAAAVFLPAGTVVEQLLPVGRHLIAQFVFGQVVSRRSILYQRRRQCRFNHRQ